MGFPLKVDRQAMAIQNTVDEPMLFHIDNALDPKQKHLRTPLRLYLLRDKDLGCRDILRDLIHARHEINKGLVHLRIAFFITRHLADRNRAANA